MHLGLGDDGHTASLFPADPALDVMDREVVTTGAQRGYRRMSLSLPALSRARRRLWLVTGEVKAAALAALLQDWPAGSAHDAGMPAARVARADSVVFADAAAAAQVPAAQR